MRNLRPVLPSVAFLASLALSAGAANATVISEWAFTVDNIWNESATSWTTAGTTPPDPFGSGAALPDGTADGGSYTYVRWGSPAVPGGSQSFLGADTGLYVTGLMTNDSTGVAGSFYYHGNYTQYSPSNTREKWLTNTELVSQITIESVDPAGQNISITRSYTISFTETLNEVPLEECPGYPWPPVGPTPDMPTCPDQLTIDISDLTFSTGVIDGYIYDFTVSFDPDSFQNIAGLTYNPDGTVTMWTNEGELSRVGTRITVTSRISEPAPLALLGAGLVMAGGLLRRRKSA